MKLTANLLLVEDYELNSPPSVSRPSPSGTKTIHITLLPVTPKSFPLFISRTFTNSPSCTAYSDGIACDEL